MRYLKKYEEVRFSDILSIKGESEYAEKLKDLKDIKFDSSHSLINQIELKEPFLNKQIKLRVRWNNTPNHSIIKRIKERTNFKSTEEFNQYFIQKIQTIIPNKIGNEINEKGRYALYDKENNFSIIIDINPDEFIRKNIYKIFVFTIIPLRRERNVIKVLDI